jgi:hypothetical protein
MHIENPQSIAEIICFYMIQYLQQMICPEWYIKLIPVFGFLGFEKGPYGTKGTAVR